MCLILVAWQQRPDFPLVVAANRDELHARPAAAAAFWKDHPDILAGRDLQANGTWLGLARNGRFASVTNYKGGFDPGAAESRGALVTNFLLGSGDSSSHFSEIEKKKNSYSGFNLLAADGKELWWLSNRDGGARRLDPGFYALGNFLLDTPEVLEVKSRFEGTPAVIEPLFSLLATAKIVAPVYGTRCSTALLSGTDGRMQFAERPFDAGGMPARRRVTSSMGPREKRHSRESGNPCGPRLRGDDGFIVSCASSGAGCRHPRRPCLRRRSRAPGRTRRPATARRAPPRHGRACALPRSAR